jgi:hypothetical protein
MKKSETGVLEYWSTGDWSTGIVEYWNIGAETHHSSTPLLHHSQVG